MYLEAGTRRVFACAVDRPGWCRSGRGRRPPRFVARRVAWHALDHAWEIQDKTEPRED